MAAKRSFLRLTTINLIALFILSVPAISASGWDLEWGRILTGAAKAVQAWSLSDDDMAGYVREYIAYSDAQNKVAPASSPYAQRLTKLTKGLNSVDGRPLNFKVYMTREVNAFAAADGSVRVNSGLMDLMTDDEVLGVIGHEIGHVANKDSKNALKQALINSAVLDGIGSLGGRAQALSDSKLAAIGEALLSSRYSRNQETAADDYGYDFLVKNGKNPWTMAEAFAKMQKLESTSQSSALLKMFSSHPDTSARIKHIVERCNADGFTAPQVTVNALSEYINVKKR